MHVTQKTFTTGYFDEAIEALSNQGGQIETLSVRERIGAMTSTREEGLEKLDRLMRILSSPEGASVTTLDLSYVKLGARGAEKVAAMLKTNQTLQKLIVESCRLGVMHDLDRNYQRPRMSGCEILVGAALVRSTQLTMDFGHRNWLDEHDKELVRVAALPK